ncbi:MAG: hypothetical protein MUF21_03745 [Gemmatimonadaceae bacterium]|jgi:hypothetical protein|nr:hypothetical protein [Gemmatimonadaceae bacterium]
MPLFEVLKEFRSSSGCTETYVMGGDATGDVPHVAVAMLANQQRAVVIFDYGGKPASKCQEALVRLGIAATRIRILSGVLLKEPYMLPDGARSNLETPPARGPLLDAYEKAIRRAKSANTSHGKSTMGPRERLRDLVSGMCQAAGFANQLLHKSTEHALATLATRENRAALHAVIRGGKDRLDTDDVLFAFWDAKKVAVDKHVVVLWGRTSGKDKTEGGELGPHVYGDSSVTGLAQLADACCKRGWQVVVAGDVAAVDATRFPGCIFIGKFWSDPHWADFYAGAQEGAPRLQISEQKAQVRLFYLLKRVLDPGKRLVHVGMRSGNLDVYAFAGQDIVYLIAQGFDDRRIEALANARTRGAQGSRWNRSTPADAPKRLFATSMHASTVENKNFTLANDAANIVKSTALVSLVPPDSKLGKSLARFKDLYPLSPDTAMRASRLYLAMKARAKALAEAKEQAAPDEQVLLDWFRDEKGRRGFDPIYLRDSLVPLIGRTLREAPNG